jgi:hypothetical protein
MEWLTRVFSFYSLMIKGTGPNILFRLAPQDTLSISATFVRMF